MLRRSFQINHAGEQGHLTVELRLKLLCGPVAISFN